MSWPKSVRDTIKKLKYIQQNLEGRFIDRTEAVRLLVLATLCREHLLLIGPPGTAKTEIVSRFTSQVDMRGFHYMLTRFTEPSELFGPLDLESFKQGSYHIRTEGMLPDAQIAFLDEVFQGSSAILNSLLTLINERLFFNGATPQRVPLIAMIGAANIVPDDPALHAFADRFVLRCELDRVAEDRIDDLLQLGWQLEVERIEAAAQENASQPVTRELSPVKSDEVLALHSRLREVELSEIRPEYGNIVRELRAEGVELSDRRAVRGLKLIAGAALLDEEATAGPQHLWPLLHIWGRPEEAGALKRVVQPRLAAVGATSLDTTRDVNDILLDLETFESQEAFIRSEAALGAHLMALSKLRRELINDHPKDGDARGRVEQAIERAMKRMEQANV